MPVARRLEVNSMVTGSIPRETTEEEKQWALRYEESELESLFLNLGFKNMEVWHGNDGKLRAKGTAPAEFVFSSNPLDDFR